MYRNFFTQLAAQHQQMTQDMAACVASGRRYQAEEKQTCNSLLGGRRNKRRECNSEQQAQNCQKIASSYGSWTNLSCLAI
jgi:hypothetical protein